MAPRSSFGNHPPTDDQPPDSWDKWNRRDTPSPSPSPWEKDSHHGKGPGPWIEGYEQRNRLDDNPAYPHYLMSAYDLRRKDTVQVQPYRKPPLKLSPHVNEPNQAFQLAPLIPALEEVSGKVIGRSLLAGAGWILTLLCLSGDTRREPLEMLPRGEDWPGPISSSVYDQLSAEEAQRYNELRYKKAAGKASEQESRDFQELEEKLVEDGSSETAFLTEHPELAEAMQHVKFRDISVKRRRGIGGAHDASEWAKIRKIDATNNPSYQVAKGKTLDQVEEVVVLKDIPHPSVPGVRRIEYKIPAIDGNANPNITTGELRGDGAKNFTKTIYDPTVWTDEKLEQAVKEAIQDAVSNTTDGTLTREWIGETVEGHKIRGYFENNHIKSFFFE